MKRKKIILFIVLILVFFSFGITYSVFSSSANLKTVNQNIASFVFDAQNLNSFEVPLLDMLPDTEREINFSVANNKDEVKSDVSINYQIIIKTYHVMPLDISLFKIIGDEEILFGVCDESFSRNSSNELVCNTKIEQMDYKGSAKDNFKLVITFPEEYNASEYSGLVDYINLEIKSWQNIEEEGDKP